MNDDWDKTLAILIATVGAITVLIGVIVILGQGAAAPHQQYANSSPPKTPSPTTTQQAAPVPTTETPSTPPTTESSESVPACNTPAQCVAAGVATATGEGSQSGATESSEAASSGHQTGTSVPTARMIRPGVREAGDSGTVAYGEGSCGPEQGEFWKVALKRGDAVRIVWGGPDNSATGLDIWPPGTTDVSGSGEGRVTYESTEGEDTVENFVAPVTGVYPLVIDDSCGQAGVFHFTLTRSR